ncbi:ATP-binding cassette domain-containing protein, partial [Salipiger mucosus]|uniref:ATP-binding cassette domain-containing protein n=1 Tax=Salipiger mucosus TaxID=263378 RepID=UPI00055A5A01
MTPPGLRIAAGLSIGGKRILDPVAITAPAGRWTCLLGPSGVGKSTLLHCLAGIAEDVTLDGEIGAEDGAPLPGRVALMAQADMLLPWLTVRDNVTFGARLRGEAPDRARADVVLGHMGLAPLAGRKPGALSGG